MISVVQPRSAGIQLVFISRLIYRELRTQTQLRRSTRFGVIAGWFIPSLIVQAGKMPTGSIYKTGTSDLTALRSEDAQRKLIGYQCEDKVSL